MKASEALLLERLLQGEWSNFAAADGALKQVKDELAALDGGEVLAATRSLAADGLQRMPSAGQIRRRMAERAVGAVPWAPARAALLLWRAACERHKADRDRIREQWSCQKCDRTGFVWVDENTTTDCECRPRLLAALTMKDDLPPVLQRFLAERHVTAAELDAMVMDTTLEAQVRDRWAAFIDGLVRSVAYAEIPQAPGLAGGDERRREVGPRTMPSALAAAGLQVMPGGEAA